jgi:hypothetical protein
MIVKTKQEASRECIKTLFKAGGTMTLNEKRVFCTGHYNEKIIGSPVVDLTDVKMVWAERRNDKDGTYYKLYCI